MAAIRDKTKKFQKFLKGLKTKYSGALPEENQPQLDRFVMYLFFYSNPITYAKKAYKAFTDDDTFTSWSEVRVSTRREITEILNDHKVKPSDFLAPRLLEFLQAVFEEADDTRLEVFLERIEAAEDAKARKAMIETVKETIGALPGVPPWGSQYLLAALGLEKCLPLDPHTEAVMIEQKIFDPTVKTVPQKKRVLKALLDGLDGLSAIDAHHLIVEYAKRDLKRK